jgi:hypothetical protein
MALDLVLNFPLHAVPSRGVGPSLEIRHGAVREGVRLGERISK